MNKKIFDIDYGKLPRLLLPVRLRKSVVLSFLKALITPLNRLYLTFKRNRKNNLYRLKITPQVVYLERLLNDKYDKEQRRITISEGVYHDPVYFFQKTENKPQYFFRKSEQQPVWFWLKSETNDLPMDFIIHVPGDIDFDESEMRGIVDGYKLAGKTYNIKQ